MQSVLLLEKVSCEALDGDDLVKEPWYGAVVNKLRPLKLLLESVHSVASLDDSRRLLVPYQVDLLLQLLAVMQ